MNKLSFPMQGVPAPANMEDALALVRAGKLQEASDLLLTGNILPLQPKPTAANGIPAANARTGFADSNRSAGWRTPGAVDIADVLAKAGLPLGAKAGAKTSAMPGRTAAHASPAPNPAAAPGEFKAVAFRHQGQDHSYWLYVPKTPAPATGRALVLMLHGCTQDAQDFACGTRMNEAAETAGAVVLYPNQLHSANANGCWNWFRPQDQQAGSGEPALLVAMVQRVTATQQIDPHQVYVAGLSAGGAMAAVLAQQYPGLFAAVGVHSGLVPGAAHTMMGALSAMSSGAKGWSAPRASVAGPVPMIVFHGDADATVHPRNGEQLLEGAASTLPTSVQSQETGTTADGQRYTRTLLHDAASASPHAAAEHWLLHGAGHEWSGGNAHGSHATAKGVDASAEMLRFFLAHPQEGDRAAA